MQKSFVLALGLTASPLAAHAAVPDHMELLVTASEAEGIYGRLGGYTYSPDTNAFWTVLYGGGAGVRRIEPGFGAIQYVYPSTIQQISRAEDIAGGVTNADFGAFPLQGAILLNPAAITVDYGDELDPDGEPIGEITYQPGQLAYILHFDLAATDENGDFRFDVTKRLLRYDLRPVGYTQPSGVGLPDRANAQDGLGNVIGQYDRVDWNDPFTTLVTEQDLRDAIGSTSTARTESNFGRQFAWSSDGESIYAIDSGNNTGGLFKIDAVTGDVERIYAEPGSSNVDAEPAVVHSSVRSFGAGVGDQIVFNGTTRNGNLGGISYVLDDGLAGEKSAQVLVSAAELDAFNPAMGDVSSMTSDDEGNLYFFDNAAQSLFRYDTQGRLVALVNEAQLLSFNHAQDGAYENLGGVNKLQVYEDASGKRLYFRNDNSRIAAVRIGVTGDFDGDEAITAQDTAFFIQQFRTAGPPTAADTAFLNYAKADLNGSGVVGKTGAYQAAAVDQKDLDALRQFVNLKAGDTDWNFLVDLSDFQTLKANFNPVGDDLSFFDGNFDYQSNGNVDLADFQALKSNFNPAEAYDVEPSAAVTAGTAAALLAEDGEIFLEVNVDTGVVELVAGGVEFDSIQIVGTGQSILESEFLGIDGFDPLVGDAYVAALRLAGSTTLDGALDLGAFYDVELDLRDLAFNYGLNGLHVGEVRYVPEPTSLALIGLVAAGLMNRRGRR